MRNHRETFPDTVVSVDYVSDTEQVVTLTDGHTFKCHPRINLQTVINERNAQLERQTAEQTERQTAWEAKRTRTPSDAIDEIVDLFRELKAMLEYDDGKDY